MENENKAGLRHMLGPEQAEHLALKEYATLRLMQVVAERDAAVLERNNAMAERKAAFAERDSALLQRDIAFAERENAIIERDAAVAALEIARGNRSATWNCQRRETEVGRKEAEVIQMHVLNVTPFGGEGLRTFAADSTMIGAGSNCGVVQSPLKQGVPAENQGSSKPIQWKKKSREAANAAANMESKRQRSEAEHPSSQIVQALREEDNIQQLSNGQVESSEPEQTNISTATSLVIPYCSCTGLNQQCYRWGNGGWQSACCTNTLSMYPLPMNPEKRGYRLPGRKMSAGAFKKLTERLSVEGVDLSKPVDLKIYWAKHGTNRYVTIK
eukprot:c26167_g1_i1 orf=156-1139(+)